ncbi:hypothetical protein [Pasteuria penetrans]|uniref:hypothetical protein n=1 Tax=Pasteuria penetrans TaxID=86005 RepID=UPI000F9A9A27|nr:hypothetical protein [Pasteuria penetrans]
MASGIIDGIQDPNPLTATTDGEGVSTAPSGALSEGGGSSKNAVASGIIDGIQDPNPLTATTDGEGVSIAPSDVR